jgi:DNA-binding transcriptional ArsR family regulator
MSPASVDKLFQALGDPTRRAIVERLSAGPATVSQLAEPLGITVTAVGQHLHVLEGGGLVTSQKTGRVRTCRLEPAGLAAIEQWIGYCRSSWEARIERLGRLLEEE